MSKNRLKVKGIILDLDGTLVDSKEAYMEAVRKALDEMGQKMISEERALEIPKRLEQRLPINDLLGDVDVKKFLKAYLKAYYEATATKTKPIRNVSRTLTRLSAKAKLAVVTMRHVSKEKVIEELKRFGWMGYFEQVMTAWDTENPKPSPEASVKCARLLGLKCAECVVVGDSLADVRAGRNAGAKTVAVLTGIFSRKELEREKPDLILKSVNELPDFVE